MKKHNVGDTIVIKDKRYEILPNIGSGCYGCYFDREDQMCDGNNKLCMAIGEQNGVYNVRFTPIPEVYSIWVEGHREDGGSSTAYFIGMAEDINFECACHKAIIKEEMEDEYDIDTNSWYGCRLFDNEADARKSFG